MIGRRRECDKPILRACKIAGNFDRRFLLNQPTQPERLDDLIELLDLAAEPSYSQDTELFALHVHDQLEAGIAWDRPIDCALYRASACVASALAAQRQGNEELRQERLSRAKWWMDRAHYFAGK